MVRPPLSPQERARGERLGMLLREARGSRSMTEIAAASGVPVETLRKIETGRIATPAFFTVAALAASVGLSLEAVVAYCAPAEAGQPLSAWSWSDPPQKRRALKAVRDAAPGRRTGQPR
jgi:transcriptional regulator with XRE-family HTH domain